VLWKIVIGRAESRAIRAGTPDQVSTGGLKRPGNQSQLISGWPINNRDHGHCSPCYFANDGDQKGLCGWESDEHFSERQPACALKRATSAAVEGVGLANR
jgi:hypothetical protein